VSGQLALDYSRAARDEGMARAADHAEGIEPGWGAAAYRVLCDYARDCDEPFTSEDFRDWLQTIQFPCPVPKALGAVFQRAARRRVIKRCGTGISRHRHLSPCPLWSRA